MSNIVLCSKITASFTLCLFATANAAHAQTTPPPLLFPVVKGADWSDTFGAPRTGHTHQGQDLMAPKLRPLIACFSGTVTLHRNQGTAGNWITLYGTGTSQGWRAEYMHLNNDTPGTNDGAGGDRYAFAPNLKNGDMVQAGQFLGYVGNSGNAETTGPHCHFELHGPNGVVNATTALRAARMVKAVDGESLLAAAPQTGPLQVEGVVLATFPDQAEAMIKVTSIKEFGGRTINLSPPRVKRLNLTGSLRATPLTKGMAVMAEGSDKGRGRPLQVVKLSVAGGAALIDTDAGSETDQYAPTGAVASGTDVRTVGATPRRQKTIIPPALLEHFVLDGFERGAYAGWRMTGDCWTNAPEPNYGGSAPRLSGAVGRYYLSTAHPRPGSYYPVSGTGVAVSPEFPVTHTKLRFLIGGGSYPDECCLNLRVGERVVRTATGSGSDRLAPVEWDIAEFVGKRAQLEIVDRRAFGQRAYVLLDELAMDGLPPPALVEPDPVEPVVLETAIEPAQTQGKQRLSSALTTSPAADVDGTAPKAFVLLPDGTRVEGTRLMTLEATGYGPGENGPWGDRTALGTKVGYGTVAVDPKVIPLRKHLWVEGYGFCIALDTGGAIKGMKIDLAHDSDAEAALEGRTKRRVLVLD